MSVRDVERDGFDAVEPPTGTRAVTQEARASAEAYRRRMSDEELERYGFGPGLAAPEIELSRARLLSASSMGEHCGSCGGSLADASLLVRLRVGLRRLATTFCPSCVHWSVAINLDAPSPCDGCGRLLVVADSSARRRHWACSARCADRARQRAARRREVLPPRSCSTCGAALPATRRIDSKTCSAGCRQRAYRARSGDRAAAAQREGVEVNP